jgi:predicted TIM-barrel fold metal-dependent hydrolase
MLIGSCLGFRPLGRRFVVVSSTLLLWYSCAWRCSSPLVSALRMSATSSTPKIIDSHLHLWANRQEAMTFPYAPPSPPPPDHLRDAASADALLAQMDEAGVDGALIVQPINYKFDHRYLIRALQEHPHRFRGMLLHDPSLSPDKAVEQVDDLVLLHGFCGVRYNPYLWNKVDETTWSSMCSETGMAVYKRCGELGVPVGIMCFQGLSLHYDDIVQFATEAPQTRLILDHFAFTAVDDDKAFDQLLSLAQYNCVHVKISALFRLKDPSPYQQVYEKRFLPLLKTYGADRLLFGSDFPYVLEQPEGYKNMKDMVASWCPDESSRAAIMGGTAQRLFGDWAVKS